RTTIGLPPRREPARDRKQRRREAMVARYWYRYCGKNDSIGFFGPVAWVEVAGPGVDTDVRHGARLEASRDVRFEAWAVQRLAARLEDDPSIRPWLAPRLAVEVHVEGDLVRQPRRPPARLTEGEAEVLRRCDGGRPARQIAAEVAGRPGGGLRREADVLLLLDNLRRRGIVTWGLRVPVGPRPERSLRADLERIGDREVRERGLAALAELEAGRDRLRAAVGPDRIDAAMGDLDDVFRRLTSTAPARSPGEAYGARTLVYLQCGRDLRARFGGAVLAPLAEPLALLLEGARWLTWRAAGAYREALRGVYRDLAADARGAPVEMSDLWFWSQAALFGTGPRPIDAVLDDFRARWFDVLGLTGPVEGREIRHAVEDLRPAVGERFAAGPPGWPGARYHSPDLQLGAASVADLAAGRVEAVLGELHVACNPLDSAAFVVHHPDPPALVRQVQVDLPEASVVPLLPDDWPRNTGHTRAMLTPPRDLRFAFAPARPDDGPNRTLALAELLVEETHGRLVVRSRDGSVALEVIHFLGELLSLVVLDGFRVLWSGEGRPAGRMPRVRVGGLVVTRESWSVPLDGVGFPAEADEAARYLAARRWAAGWGMPRFVFASVPGEVKPYFVDLRSVTSVNLLTTSLRRARQAGLDQGRLTVTEMLPTPDQAWLPDGEGGGCCSELRLLLVDTRSVG
ncbi:MAG TPA: lantibiotic dehydratase, partial [Candidatus Eisenbacteria bacterium]|nr:lantibiotic dehydratase [Candidatus Eisenbacteria bacterium]